MRALHLSTWHPFIDGVSGTFVVEQCAALRAAGVDAGLIFGRIEGLRGLSPRRLMRGCPGFVHLDSPIPTYGFKTWNVPGTRAAHSAIFEWALRSRYHAYVKAVHKPDILHAHVALEAGRVARRLAAETGLEYIITEHSSEIINGLKDPQRAAAAREVYQGARRVIAVSDGLAQRISDIAPTARIIVIPNLVRESTFRLKRSGVQNEEALVVCSIGGLVPGKRTNDAIAAIAGLPVSLKSRIQYHIVGEGAERQRLMRQARDCGVRTHFHGNLPNRKAMQLLSEADVLLHASGYETFGLVIAEAMALGVPVVATRSGGPESFVTAETGRLVAVGDIPALRDSLREILETRNRWASKRDEISDFARGRFHEKAVAAAIIEEYK
jgi:glycosyltransferase involved in cell wall biosynthesis